MTSPTPRRSRPPRSRHGRSSPGFSLPKYAVDSLTHYKNNPESFKNEVLSGITVAVMQVPESVAFSFVAGVPPLVAVWKSKFYGEFVLNRRVDLAIDARLLMAWRCRFLAPRRSQHGRVVAET